MSKAQLAALEGPANARSDGEMNRMEAFSDGIFAIALTLLILELKVPKEGVASNASLWEALGALWPSYLALVTSFATLLIMWINHHGIFKLVKRPDASFMFANGFLLLLVTIIPFPTALVAEHLTHGGREAACVLYCGTFVVVNLAYNLLWYTASRDRRLLAPHVSDEYARALQRRMLAGLPVYLGAMVAAFFNAYLGMGLCSILWILWARSNYEVPTEARPRAPRDEASAAPRGVKLLRIER